MSYKIEFMLTTLKGLEMAYNPTKRTKAQNTFDPLDCLFVPPKLSIIGLCFDMLNAYKLDAAAADSIKSMPIKTEAKKKRGRWAKPCHRSLPVYLWLWLFSKKGSVNDADQR